ncbi:MAG: aminopeptidase P family protein [Proteobacteria bacterium]|nr:aminopeptidase P family protein [Pseudomonadota bacterium]
MPSESRLMIAASERDANMLYAAGMFADDALIYLRLNGRSHLIVSDAGLGRARKEAAHCRILPAASLMERLRKAGHKKVTPAHLAAEVLKGNGLRKVEVPVDFPLGYARELRDVGIKVKPVQGEFFPEREIKSAAELKKINAALVMAEVGLSEGLNTLKNAKIARDGKLVWRGLPLTADRLRAVIDAAVVQAGGVSARTIVAGGRQGSDPSQVGHGVLRANQPILIDVCPRSRKTGFYADITRTVVKGRATDAVRKMYRAVESAQELGLSLVRDGAEGRALHRAIIESLKQAGFETARRNGRLEGFVHAAGHGVGLDLHEAPRLNGQSRDRLRVGQVLTIEPGLYYPDIGGVRLEDVAVVTRHGARNLTKSEKTLEL